MPSYRLLSWLVYPLISKGEEKMNKAVAKWTPIVKTVSSSLGPIAEIYAKTLAYKIETKRLEVELTRIEREANVRHDDIDKKFKLIDKKLKLEVGQLELRRMELVGFYQTVNGELQRQHITREKVLEMAQLAQQKSFESGLPIEERRMHNEMAIEMTKQVRLFGDQANETLQKLVNALPPAKIPLKLLNG